MHEAQRSIQHRKRLVATNASPNIDLISLMLCFQYLTIPQPTAQSHKSTTVRNPHLEDHSTMPSLYTNESSYGNTPPIEEGFGCVSSKQVVVVVHQDRRGGRNDPRNEIVLEGTGGNTNGNGNQNPDTGNRDGIVGTK